MNQFDAMMKWENGELNQDEEIELFQNLINTGLAWRLQGVYGRHAKALIDAGLIFPIPDSKDETTEPLVEEYKEEDPEWNQVFTYGTQFQPKDNGQ